MLLKHEHEQRNIDKIKKTTTKKNGLRRIANVTMVPKAGLEPARSFLRRILSPLRLPFRHLGMDFDIKMEAPPRFELGVKALQASALPLGYGASPLCCRPCGLLWWKL